MKKTVHICLSMAILCVAMSFSYKAKPGASNCQLTIAFKHIVGNELLKLDSITYKNDLGQPFTISKFKYYISNFHFKNSNGKDLFINESFIIDEDEEESKKIILKNISEGDYTAVDFIIGVDSLHNCSGAQSGALDPVNTMYWAWNTGYIFLKLEGTSKFSKSPGNFFEYHIGGYKQPNNNIRKVSFTFDQPLKTETKKLQNINFKVNILELLKTPTSINFEKLSSITDLRNANTIADNYSDMFELIK